MKVIERREPPFGEWPRQFLCPNCQSTLEIEATDVKQPGQRDSSSGWLKCPVCLQTITLTPKETRQAFQYRTYQVERLRAQNPAGGCTICGRQGHVRLECGKVGPA